jgi:hypothetical protein
MFGFAAGGSPPVGVPSIVGERGPEIFIPNSAGTIIPNHMIKGYADGAGLSALSVNSRNSYHTSHNTFHLYGVKDGKTASRTIANYIKSTGPQFAVASS